MQIWSAPELSVLEEFLRESSPASARVLSRLSAEGELDPSLCFAAADGEKTVGALVIVPVRSGEVSAAFAACAVCSDEHTLSQMYFRAFGVLRERGMSYIFARFSDGEKNVYFDRLKWEWLPVLGFVPPVLDESALGFGGKRLDDSAKPSCLPIEFPRALDMPVPEARFEGNNIVSEEEIATETYTARDRRRLAERAALILFIIAVLAFGIIKSGTLRTYLSSVPVLGLGMYLLFLNIYRPRKLVADMLAKRREKGLDGADERYFFGEDRFIWFSEGKATAITSYESIIAVYVKPDFLFLCSRSGQKSAAGWFVRRSSLSDEQGFLDHIGRKSPGAVFKK